MGKIKFIYFDLGGVVFHWKNSLAALAHYVNEPEEKCWSVFKKYDDDACRGLISPKQLWNKYRDELHSDKNIEDFVSFWTHYFDPIYETHALIKKLSLAYEIGILSNIYKGVYEVAINTYIPLIEYKVIVKSCDVGFTKPNKAIFDFAVKETHYTAEKILLIDDNALNIETAKSLQWNTFLFEENNPGKSVEGILRLLAL